MVVGGTGRNAEGADRRTHIARLDFLLLVLIEYGYPLENDIIQCLHAVGVGAGIAGRNNHSVGPPRQCVVELYRRGRVDIPIDLLAASVGFRFGSGFVSKVLHDVVALQEQTRQNGIADMMLRINEGIADAATEYYFLAYHEVVGFACGIRTLCQHAHRTRLNSRQVLMIDRIVDDGYGLGLTGQHAGGSAEEYIRIGADTLCVFGRRGGNLLIRGEGIAVLGAEGDFMGQRNTKGELFGKRLGHTFIRTCTIGSGNRTESRVKGGTPGRLKFHTDGQVKIL